jgi:hypothetical protein
MAKKKAKPAKHTQFWQSYDANDAVLHTQYGLALTLYIAYWPN